MINLNSKITIEELHAWMDGGSVTLICRNDQHQKFEIEFVQNVDLELYDPNRIPGRIYLNKHLIDQRSELEIQIIKGLKTVQKELKDHLERRILQEKLDYIHSENYLTDQKKIIKKVRRT
jgi:hypothetical protein